MGRTEDSGDEHRTRPESFQRGDRRGLTMGFVKQKHVSTKNLKVESIEILKLAFLCWTNFFFTNGTMPAWAELAIGFSRIAT